jgi:hypothetical protein
LWQWHLDLRPGPGGRPWPLDYALSFLTKGNILVTNAPLVHKTQHLRWQTQHMLKKHNTSVQKQTIPFRNINIF